MINVMDILSTVELFNTVRGYQEYRGGYLEYRRRCLEYRGGCSVLWGYHDTCGIVSTVGGSFVI